MVAKPINNVSITLQVSSFPFAVDWGERKSFEVNAELGPVKTLDQALQMVDPFTTIYLTEGVYQCPNPIRKPGLIITKRDADKKVYIIGNQGAVVNVE